MIVVCTGAHCLVVPPAPYLSSSRSRHYSERCSGTIPWILPCERNCREAEACTVGANPGVFHPWDRTSRQQPNCSPTERGE